MAFYQLQGMMALSMPTKTTNHVCCPRLNVDLKQLDSALEKTSWWGLGFRVPRQQRSDLLVSNGGGHFYQNLHVSCSSQGAVVANRALDIIGGDKAVSSYYLGWQEAQSNPYDEQTNPGGCIQLGLSENQEAHHDERPEYICFTRKIRNHPQMQFVDALVCATGVGISKVDANVRCFSCHGLVNIDLVSRGRRESLSLGLLEEWFSTHDTAPTPELEPVLGFMAIACYPDVYHGLKIFRSLLARFMDDIFGGGVHFDAHQMVVTTGATAAIELLAFCLADPGDVFLVPAPYYPGYDRDITFRSQVSLVPVQSSSENNFLMTRKALEQAYDDTLKTGRIVKAILITSPSNPLGVTYNEDYLQLILDFIKEKDLHLICNELYAGTVYSKSKFVSMAELSVSPLHSSRVHIVYGLSKILGLPGYRVGLLYSWNLQVLDAAQKLTRFSSVSTHTQQLLVALLSDRQFLRSYISENQRRLGDRWQLVRNGLEEAGLEFIECESGFFCWVNLGNLLDALSRDGELMLWRKLLYEVGVNMTPGSACHCDEPGWFRLCFAFVDDKTIGVALNRIQQLTASTERAKQSRLRYP